MEKFFAVLALCERDTLINGGYRLDNLNKRLNKLQIYLGFDTLRRSSEDNVNVRPARLCGCAGESGVQEWLVAETLAGLVSFSGTRHKIDARDVCAMYAEH